MCRFARQSKWPSELAFPSPVSREKVAEGRMRPVWREAPDGEGGRGRTTDWRQDWPVAILPSSACRHLLPQAGEEFLRCFSTEHRTPRRSSRSDAHQPFSRETGEGGPQDRMRARLATELACRQIALICLSASSPASGRRIPSVFFNGTSHTKAVFKIRRSSTLLP